MSQAKSLFAPLLKPFSRRSASAAGFIGIDIRREGISLVQLTRDAQGQLGILAQAFMVFAEEITEPLSITPAMRRQLRQTLRSGGFKDNKIVAALDSKYVKLFPVTYSEQDNGVEGAIAKLLKDRETLNVADHVVDFIPIRSENRHGPQKAIVALADRQAVDDYLELLNQTGLEINALDIRPAAMARLVTQISMDADYETELVITTGQEKSYLTIISGRRLLFDQEVMFGEKQLLSLFSESLEMPQEQVKTLFYQHGFSAGAKQLDDESVALENEFSQVFLDLALPQIMSLVDEISRVAVYVSAETRGKPLSKVYLCGSIADVDGLTEVLADRLELKVESLCAAFCGLLFNDQLVEVHPEAIKGMAIATGLALRGMPGERERDEAGSDNA